MLDDRRREDRQPEFGIEPAGAADDQFETAAAFFERADLVERTNCRGNRGKQLAAGELGFGLVIVDVVIGDRVEFRRVTRLTGAQDDAHGSHGELVANAVDGDQTRVFAFHDDIEQDDGNIAVAIENRDCLVGTGGMQEAQGAAEDPQVMQREFGRMVHILVVVDDQYLPACIGRIRGLQPGGIFNQVQMIVVVVHYASRMGSLRGSVLSMAGSPAKTKSPAGLLVINKPAPLARRAGNQKCRARLSQASAASCTASDKVG